MTADFVATTALCLIIALVIFIIIGFIINRLALNIKDEESREWVVGISLACAFITVFGFFIIF